MEKSIEKQENTINDLIHNYLQEEKSVVSQLYFKSNHGTTIGGFREEIWKDLFERIVPKKFVVDQSVFLIDSNGSVSKEVDLAIFDEMYTPYIFQKGRLKFIPIEAVAVAIECKSKTADYDSLETWVTKMKELKTSRKGIARMHGYIAAESKKPSTQTATRPILIYCYLGERKPSDEKLFDFALHAKEATGKIEVTHSNEANTLEDYYKLLNHVGSPEGLIKDGELFINDGEYRNNFSIDDYRVCKGQEEVSLLSFTFMLNQLLMIINNPMLFPHKAYVDMFNTNRIGKHE